MCETIDGLNIRKYDFDQDLIAHVRNKRTASSKIYIPEEPAVILGKGSKPSKELFVDNCLEDLVPIYQRAGGGCAVVIDPGNIVISVVLPTKGISDNNKYFDWLSQWVIGNLENIGISDIYQDGISDLVIDNKKIGGSSIYRSKDFLYYSTTILVQPRIDLMARYLKHPPREPEYRKGRSHKDFIGTLTVDTSADKTKILSVELENSLFNAFNIILINSI